MRKSAVRCDGGTFGRRVLCGKGCYAWSSPGHVFKRVLVFGFGDCRERDIYFRKADFGIFGILGKGQFPFDDDGV